METKTVQIPRQLWKPEYRFVKIARGTKAPFEREWQKENNYRWDNENLQQHLRDGGNYGVLGGYGKLIIIDADKEQVVNAIHQNLPATFTVKSGSKGFHFYYVMQETGKPIRLTINKEDGVGSAGDVQSFGKQVVGAGSLHPNGNKYLVANDAPISEVTEEQVRFALRDFVTKEPVLVTDPKHRPFLIEQIIDVGKLTRIGGEFCGSHPLHGSTGGTNFWVNTDKQVWHCFRCNVGGDAWTLLAMLDRIIVCDQNCYAIKYGCLRDKDKWRAVMQSAKNRGLITTMGEFSDGDFAEHVLLAKTLLGEYNFLTTMEDGDCYFYKDGVYVRNAEAHVNELVERMTDGDCNNKTRQEVLGHIKAATYVPMTDVDNNKRLVNLKNGLLNLDTGQLVSHTPDYKTIAQVPVVYDASKDCPAFKQFLGEVLRPQDIPIVQEIFGYCLARTHVIHKAFLFTGSGRNGKSTLLNVLKSFLGEANVSSVSLQKLAEDKFSLAELKGKLANIFPDLPQKPIEDSGVFKGLVGEDRMQAERKYAHPFNFVNTAKLVFSCNSIPENQGDDSDAFFHRWIILNFNKTFVGRDAKKGLAATLTTNDELSGILNWSIEGLLRLFKQQDFSYDVGVDELRKEYLKKSNPLAAFIQECLFEDSDSYVDKQVLYATFAKYCRDNHLAVVGEIKFCRDFPKLANVYEQRISDKGGGRVRVWSGVAIRPDVRNVQRIPLSSATFNMSNSGEDREKCRTPWTSGQAEELLVNQLGVIPTSFSHLKQLFVDSAQLSEVELTTLLAKLKKQGDVLENPVDHFIKLK